MPFNGSKPTMAPTLIIVWKLNQTKTPTAINLVKSSGDFSAILAILQKSAVNSANKLTVPIKPNFSANMAKIESLAASGK